MSDEVAGLLKQLFARSLMQRHFLAALLRRLALDVPDLDVELLQEHLYGLAQNSPHNPGTRQSAIEAAGREELEALIAMVEEVIQEVREK
jgi:hypothetical protein